MSPSTATSIVKDFLERAAWTAGQVFFSVLLVTESAADTFDLPWLTAGATAIGAALVSVITTFLMYLPELKKRLGDNFLLDLLLRLVKTFLAAFLGVAGAGALNILEFDWANAFNLAVLATLSSLGKGALARSPGPNDNPSTLGATTYGAAYSTR